MEELGPRSSYHYRLEALRAHLREGTPLPWDADDALADAELIDAVDTARRASPPTHACT